MSRRLALFAVVMAVWVNTGADGLGADRLLSAREQLVVNGLVDNVLITVQRELSSMGLGTAVLPDIAGKNGQLSVTGTDGMLSSLSSLYRSAGAVVEYGNGSVSFRTTLSLATLQVSYRVKATLLFLSQTLDVGTSVETNRISLEAGIYYEGDSCHVAVKNVEVTALQGISWRTTGYSVIDAAVSAALNLIVPPAKIKVWLNDALMAAMNKYRRPCYQFIPGVQPDLNWKC